MLKGGQAWHRARTPQLRHAARQPRGPRLRRAYQSRGRRPEAFGRATSQKCAVRQVVTSHVVKDIVLYRMQFAKKTSRLMSPFSKHETGHESSLTKAFHPYKPILAVPGTALPSTRSRQGSTANSVSCLPAAGHDTAADVPAQYCLKNWKIQKISKFSVCAPPPSGRRGRF